MSVGREGETDCPTEQARKGRSRSHGSNCCKLLRGIRRGESVIPPTRSLVSVMAAVPALANPPPNRLHTLNSSNVSGENIDLHHQQRLKGCVQLLPCARLRADC